MKKLYICLLCLMAGTTGYAQKMDSLTESFALRTTDSLRQIHEWDSVMIAEKGLWNVYKNIPWVRSIKINAVMHFERMTRKQFKYMRSLLLACDTFSMPHRMPNYARLIKYDSLPPERITGGADFIHHMKKTLFFIPPKRNYFYLFTTNGKEFSFYAFFPLSERNAEVVDPQNPLAEDNPVKNIQRQLR